MQNRSFLLPGCRSPQLSPYLYSYFTALWFLLDIAIYIKYRFLSPKHALLCLIFFLSRYSKVNIVIYISKLLGCEWHGEFSKKNIAYFLVGTILFSILQKLKILSLTIFKKIGKTKKNAGWQHSCNDIVPSWGHHSYNKTVPPGNISYHHVISDNAGQNQSIRHL